jgi:hypothetical protein
VTNGNGYFTSPNLLPGEYQVTISATGFNTITKSGITINGLGGHLVRTTVPERQIQFAIKILF